MARANCEVRIKPDTRWPADDNGEVPLEGKNPDNGSKFTGWWTRAHLDLWLKGRNGRITSAIEDDGSFMVIAELTDKEQREGWYRR